MKFPTNTKHKTATIEKENKKVGWKKSKSHAQERMNYKCLSSKQIDSKSNCAKSKQSQESIFPAHELLKMKLNAYIDHQN